MKGWYLSAGEMLWALAWSSAILALTCLPYLWAYYHQTAEFEFSGLVYDVKDCTTYLAEMHQGARGQWLLHLPFTPEDHPRAFVHSLYLILGKLAAALGQPMIVVYHLARLLCGLLLLLTSYLFLSFFTSHRPLRRIAFLLVGFSSGLGWLLLLTGQPGLWGDMPIDFWVPEAFTWPIVYGFPHISLSVALLLGTIVLFLLGVERERVAFSLLGGVACFVLGLIVPFDVPVVYAAVNAYLVALTIRGRRLPFIPVKHALILGAVSAPSLLYNLYIFTFNPAFQEWSRQNLGFSPHPLHYLVSYALLSLLAIGGAVHYLRVRDPRGLFLVSWVLADFVLIYIPFNLQRRLIVGIHPSLCLLAGVGFVRWILPSLLRSRPLRWLITCFPSRYSRRGLGQWFVCGFVLVTTPSNLLLMAGSMMQASHHEEPIFHPRAVVKAIDWLEDHAQPTDIILSTPEESNYIPARSGNWVFIGHPAITSHYEEKKRAVEAFFGDGMSDKERETFLREYNIAYVFYGPQERALGTFAPETKPFLEKVYGSSGVEIYRVSQSK